MQPDLALDLPSDLSAIEGAVEHVVRRSRAAGFDDDDRLRLNLRVSVAEALANAMLYGNLRDPTRRVRLEARFEAQRVVVRVTDEGKGFDPEALPDPTLPEHVTRPGGRGIFLIRSLMDAVEFNERGNAVTMVLERGESADGAGGT